MRLAQQTGVDIRLQLIVHHGRRASRSPSDQVLAHDAGNPQITVILSGMPAGDDYDLAAYFICGSGGDSGNCTAGTADNMIGRGCVSATMGSGTETVGMGTECSGTDDGGTLLIHITARTFGGSCGNYTPEIDVH